MIPFKWFGVLFAITCGLGFTGVVMCGIGAWNAITTGELELVLLFIGAMIWSGYIIVRSVDGATAWRYFYAELERMTQQKDRP